MSQLELAKALGVSDKAISAWEKDTRIPRMGAIQKIADFFNIQKSYLIEEEKAGEYLYTYKEQTMFNPLIDTLLQLFKSKEKTTHTKFVDKQMKVYLTDYISNYEKELTKKLKNIPHITPDEQALLDAYRNASERDKNLVDTILRISEK
jgi:transcriptional regulator with XRE-family HTH domain